MNEQYYQFLEALSYVRFNYLSSPAINNTTNEGERVFCYEIYHQLRSLIPENLDLTAEQVKSPSVLIGLAGVIQPDLIIHRHGDMENQKLAIEVKSNRNTISRASVFNDLQKIHGYVTGVLQYENAVFLIGNVRFGSIYNQFDVAQKTWLEEVLCRWEIEDRGNNKT